MTVNSREECQAAHTVIMLSDAVSKGPECDQQSPSEEKCQDHANLKTDVVNISPSSMLDVDLEKGKLETVESNEETLRSLKTEDRLTRVLQREISLHVGGKFMQLLMNNTFELPKFTSRDKCMAERVFDTPTNRSRKYKLSTSFNSRRVVLLSSVLSSMGTMILIFLTLRVRQITEASANV